MIVPSLAQIRAEKARRHFRDFVEATCRFTLEPWQRYIADTLEELVGTTGKRILIHAPPQAGKSILVSQRFPAWAIGRQPDIRIRLACYNEQHAEGFSNVLLDIMRSEEYRSIFPNDDCWLSERVSAIRWFTKGRLAHHDGQPTLRALGLGSGFTGLGGDLLIIDDPYKDRVEAFSETIRERIWQWWLSTAKPRLADANIVVMFHRWCLDDLAGRLLEEGEWDYIRFPALADGREGDPSGRSIGQSLSPRFTVEWYQQMRDGDPVGFQALFQGDPIPEGGAMVKGSWWRYWYPADRPEPEPLRYTDEDGVVQTSVQIPLPTAMDEIMQSWDMGFVASRTADYTVGQVWGRHQANLFLLDEARDRVDEPEAEDLVIDLTRRWPDSYAKLVEAKALGPRVVNRLQTVISGLTPMPVDGDKKARLQACLPIIRSGNVYLPHPAIFPWVREWRAEVETFPVARYDDRVDACSQALNYLMEQDWSFIERREPGRITVAGVEFQPQEAEWLAGDETEDEAQFLKTFYGVIRSERTRRRG